MNRLGNRGSFGKWMAVFLARFFFVLVLFAFGSGCATRVISPKNIPDPTSVAVVDYGLHSSLVLPRESGESMEYAYGQWKWFAQEKTGFWRAFPALFWPHAGTIGRRPMPFPPSDARVLQAAGAKRVTSFQVSAAAASKLERRLDAEFAGSSTNFYSPAQDMYFAKVPDSYWGGHNCNTVLSEWLKELGCQVKGPAFFSNFQISQSQ